jgi:hypothetical protein
MYANIHCKCSIHSNITFNTHSHPPQKEQDQDGIEGTVQRISNIMGGRGLDGQKKDVNDDDDKDGTMSRKEEEDTVEKEEQEFTRWFGSLKDEENMQPKDEAVQVDLRPYCTSFAVTVYIPEVMVWVIVSTINM